MGFDLAFQAAASFLTPTSIDDFRRCIEPAWIEAAFEATGIATLRKRKLPVEHVIWVVLGMVLFRREPMEDVVRSLDLVLPGADRRIAKSSITQARARVGPEPLRWLFEFSASIWAGRSADKHRWRGLSIMGIDGSSLRVPDSPENRATFGGQNARNETESGYPLVRIVVLMALRSHLLLRCAFGAFPTSEMEYARLLLPSIPIDSLTIVDRGFFSAQFLLAIEARPQGHWLTRGKSTLNGRRIQRFGKGDELIELKVWPAARRKDPSLPKTWQMRMIKYRRKGFREQVLLTSLRDPKLYPASEIIALYHERWELELGCDEIKTNLLEREETIRSRTPEGVKQEVWGIVLAYNLVRLQMESIADEANVAPTRISFVESLRIMRVEWHWLSGKAPGAIPKHLEEMRREVKRYVLPERRDRTFPRAVKLKMSNYDRKRPLIETAK